MKSMRWVIVCACMFMGRGAAFGQMLVEAEAFQLRGDWMVESKPGTSGGKMLYTVASNSDAFTLINVASSGRYALWTRALDFAQNKPRERKFQLVVDNVPAEKESGCHGREGWYWERVGEMELAAGDHVLGLRDSAKFFGRCDAVFLTEDETNPNDLSQQQLDGFRVSPKQLKAQVRQVGSPYRSAPVLQAVEKRALAEIQNEQVRISFRSARDAEGKQRIVRQTELQINGAWQLLPLDGSGEMLALLSSAKSSVNTVSFIPTWPQGKTYLEFEVEGKKYRTGAGGQNPFLAGDPTILEPKRCRVIDSATIEVEYGVSEKDDVIATGRWQLLPNRIDARFALSFKAPRKGEYSVAFCAFGPLSKEQEQFHLLPPLYQFQRSPEGPAMITSSCTPHPLALTQGKLPGIETPVTLAVTADPAELPFVWPTATNARYGFAIKNPQNESQPAAFSPVLGLEGSALEAGQTKTVSFHVMAMPGDWKQTLEYTSSDIFEVKDYRKQDQTSLTHAALNMIDLLKDQNAGGWESHLKGYYNIEGKELVTHSSPMTVLSAAILTNDEQMYVQRALPTIEYTLSRPGAHFALRQLTENNAYIKEESLKLTVPTKFFGTSYWQGVHELLGRANPWIAEMAMNKGEPRYASSYSTLPKWSELLAAYRLNPDAKLLQRIESECQAFIKKELYGKHVGDLGLMPFYNISFYPYWWDLMDLYELTHNPDYVRAAEEGAFHTMAGMWVAPQAPEGRITVHPKGRFQGVDNLWWKGDKPFRLGWPRKEGDISERSIPAWKVSQVGLGFEQPVTFYHGKGSMFNIMMSAWAPNLLRVYGQTGREIYQTFARNSVIGRYGNYPGYYLIGQSDQQMDPQYPYNGPDLTSVYYHHIPPHLAFTLDFLVAEANVRSKGAISFPWARQQGYVWFTNRVYGFGQGNIFSDPTVRLSIDRKLADVPLEQVNYLVGRGENRLWVVLLNESDETVTTPVKLGADAKVRFDGQYEVYDAQGKIIARGKPAEPLSAKIPPKGLVALSLPAADDKPVKLSPLAGGHVTQEIGGEWGQLHAFRIRSPFGKDSLYVVFTGRPGGEAAVTLNLEGHDSALEMKRFPYECSLYGWPMDRDMKLQLTLSSAKGEKKNVEEILLPGTK